jgi:hypothetical protein
MIDETFHHPGALSAAQSGLLRNCSTQNVTGRLMTIEHEKWRLWQIGIVQSCDIYSSWKCITKTSQFIQQRKKRIINDSGGNDGANCASLIRIVSVVHPLLSFQQSVAS